MTLPPAGHGYRPQASGKVNPQPPQGGAGVNMAASEQSLCEHDYAWVSPAGTSASLPMCQKCHQPEPEWLTIIDRAHTVLANARLNAEFARGPVSIREVREWLR